MKEEYLSLVRSVCLQLGGGTGSRNWNRRNKGRSFQVSKIMYFTTTYHL